MLSDVLPDGQPGIPATAAAVHPAAYSPHPPCTRCPTPSNLPILPCSLCHHHQADVDRLEARVEDQGRKKAQLAEDLQVGVGPGGVCLVGVGGCCGGRRCGGGGCTVGCRAMVPAPLLVTPVP